MNDSFVGFKISLRAFTTSSMKEAKSEVKADVGFMVKFIVQRT
jgi:hypothetical protein